MNAPHRLPDVMTTVSTIDMFEAFQRAWPEGGRASIIVLLAQWAHETGRGKSMHCFNVGNSKHVRDSSKSWTFFKCNEVIDGKIVWFYPDDPACCFDAFESLDEGVAAYFAEMRTRFAGAWPFVIAGDPVGFVKKLKAERYFTADEATYETDVVSLFKEFTRTVATNIVYPPSSVASMQATLAKAGFDPGPIDGIPGTRTRAALVAFQRSRGLVGDALLGPLTRAALLAVT